MTDIATRLQNLIEADPDPAMVELYTACLREIERLTAQAQSMAQSITTLTLDNARLTKERDKLRDVLTWVNENCRGKCEGITRRALEHKP